MSRDVLDLIDNAIAGATSEDAMRWTPDAEKVTKPSLTFADLMRGYENALDARVLGPQVGPALMGPTPISADAEVEHAWTLARVAQAFDVPAELIQGPPHVHGFTAPTIRSPIWTQVWEDPHTQRVWIAPLGTPQPVGPIEDNPVWVEADSLAQPAIDLATTASVSLADSLSSFLRHAGASVAPAVETMRRAGMVPEQPPEDPMARALWLRQHRNTGPAVQSRTPRRIDPRRAR